MLGLGGNDTICGEGGNDLAFGGVGNDKDVCTGGSGADTVNNCEVAC